MKKFYATLVFMICAIALHAQNTDFNNSSGDQLWSTPGNWSLGAVPTASNTVRLPLIVESIVDTDITITKLQTTFATGAASPGGTAIISGSATLTIDNGAANANAIENVSNNDVTLAFAGNLEINNPSGFTLMRMANGAGNSIMFMDGSTLTLTTPLGTQGNGSSFNYNFNGTLAGGANLRFGPSANATFGATANHAGFTGEIVFLGNSVATVNMADNNVFLPSGTKVQANGNAVMQVNGENNIQGFISVGGSNTLTFDVNANQNSMETIEFDNNGTLVLDIDPGITSLNFADNSAADWGNGTLNIVGFQSGVVRFGTDDSALTDVQLNQINVDSTPPSLFLDSNGFLVTTLSTDNPELNVEPILYSTVVTDVLNFTRPMDNVKILDMTGRILMENNKSGKTTIEVSSLSSGVYIIAFDNKTTEKFVKK
jgi:hypothetical protein